MSIQILIPTQLRSLTNQQAVVEVLAATVAAAIEELEVRHPGLRERILDEQGTVRRFVNIYVNQDDIRFLDSLATSLKAGDAISIIPAIAGG
jgi:sulfur-carrier protein